MVNGSFCKLNHNSLVYFKISTTMSFTPVFWSWCVATLFLVSASHFSDSAELEKPLEPVAAADEETGYVPPNVTLTGNPQIDYVHDPNLPRELNGYNLSDYPFYSRPPANLNFSCDGRKDGFYASVEHKCQIYHHCLFGVRYDFTCANYTAFDQRTFICRFVSDVDCPNSHLYFHRNKDLYVAKETTTAAPIYIDREIYSRPRAGPGAKLKPKLGPGNPGHFEEDSRSSSADNKPFQKIGGRHDLEEEEEDYEEDLDYERPAARHPARLRPLPQRRKQGKCQNGRRGRHCRQRRPRPTYYYDDDDYAYGGQDDDEYDFDYNDYYENKPGRGRKRARIQKVNSSRKSQGTTSYSSTEAPTTTSTTTTKATTTTTSTTTTQSPRIRGGARNHHKSKVQNVEQVHVPATPVPVPPLPPVQYSRQSNRFPVSLNQTPKQQQFRVPASATLMQSSYAISTPLGTSTLESSTSLNTGQAGSLLPKYQHQSQLKFTARHQ